MSLLYHELLLCIYPAVQSAHDLLSLKLLYRQPVYTALDKRIVCSEWVPTADTVATRRLVKHCTISICMVQLRRHCY